MKNLVLAFCIACLFSVGYSAKHVIKLGDTFGGIANPHGFTANELASMNHIKVDAKLKLGDTLVYPGDEDIRDARSWCKMKLLTSDTGLVGDSALKALLTVKADSVARFRQILIAEERYLRQHVFRFVSADSVGIPFESVFLYAEVWRNEKAREEANRPVEKSP